MDQRGGEPSLTLDLSRFASQAFGAGRAPNPTEFMAILGQAIQLLRPHVVWVDLLHLSQLAAGRDSLEGTGPAALRGFLEDNVQVSAISRNLVSVRSAARPPTAILLDLGSPADWMRFYNSPPNGEIDDLDAEDILVLLVNALQRMDLEEIGGVSVDVTQPIAGDFGETCASIKNFCIHQGLDCLLARCSEADQLEAFAKHYRLFPLTGEADREFTAWRLSEKIRPDQALATIKTITSQKET